jgi:hypothetical protein
LQTRINFTILTTDKSLDNMNRFDAEELRRDSWTLQSCLDPKAKEYHPDIRAFGWEFTQFSQLEEQHTRDFRDLFEDNDAPVYAKLKTEIDIAGNNVKSAILPLARQSCFRDETCLSILKKYEDRATNA